MPINYDELLEQPDVLGEAKPQQPADVYTGLLNDIDALNQEEASRSLFANQGVNPDQAAKAKAIAPQVGVPAALVETDLQGFEQQAQLTAARDTLRKNPVLAQWVAANPESARIAKDDFDQLGVIEKTMRSLSSGWEIGAQQDILGRANNLRQIGALTGIDTATADAEAERARRALREQPQLEGFYGTLQAGSGMAKSIVQNFIRGAVPGAAVGAGLGAAGGPIAPASVPAGMAAGALIGFNADAALVATGLAYEEMENARDRTGQPLSEGSKLIGSALVGTLTYQLNKIGVGVANKVKNDAVSALTREAVTEAMTRPTVQRALGDFGKALAKGGLQGAALNGAMELTILGGTEVAKQIEGGNWDTVFNDPATRQEFIHRLGDAAEMGAILFGSLHTLGAGARFIGDTTRARQAQLDVQTFQNLMEGTAQSKTFQRSPDTISEFLRAQSEGQPTENIFLPGAKVLELYQSAGIEPGAGDGLFGFVDDLPQQLQQAVNTGGDVVIPTADFIRHMAGTPIAKDLMPDIRVRPDAMTMREAEEFYANYEQTLADNAVELKAQVERQVATALPMQQVFDDIFSKLRLAGQTADVARQNASLLAARYATRAERNEGVFGDALAEYQREGIEVRRELPESLKYIPVTQTDLLLNVLRGDRKLPSDKDLFGPSLLEWVKQRGGMFDDGGELKAMDAHKVRGVVRKAKAEKGAALPGMKAGEADPRYTLDDTARAAWEAGYLPEFADRPDINTFLEVLRAELRGQKRYAGENIDQKRADFRAAVDDMDEVLTRLGLDVKTATNEQIKAALEAYQRDGVGAEYGQTPYQASLANRLRSAKSTRDENAGGMLDSYDEKSQRYWLDASPPKNGKLKLYRATPDGAPIRPGDYVTNSRKYAQQHIEANLGGKGKVVEVNAELGEILPADGPKEFFYYPKDDMKYAVNDLNQSERGKITIGDGQNIITLFRDADTSTFLHETGHKFMDELARDAMREGAPAQLKADLDAVLKWVGAKDYAAMTVEQHEQFARGFEAYLMEGKAPSSALASAFQKFKAWLIGIYREIRNLNSPINDDIRGVMDRLLASDEEIARARDLSGLNPIFKTAEDAGMTQAEFKAYTEGMAKESVEASDKLLKRAMKDIRRRRTEEWKQEYAAMREDVDKEVRARNDLRAQAYLRNGRLLDEPERVLADDEKLKLSKAMLVEMYSHDEVLRALPKGVYAAEGGVHPDVVAERFGYASGDDMVRALMSLEAQRRVASEQAGKSLSAEAFMRRLTDEETQRRMEERHGDMLKDGSIEAEALAVVHSDAQAKLMNSELRYIARMMGGDPYISAEMIRDWAQGEVASMPIKRVANTGQFARAEAAAARDVSRALLKGDYTAAFDAQVRRITNSLMFKAATEAAEDYEKGQQMFRRYARNKQLASTEQSYLDQIHGLLERIGIGTKRAQTTMERPSLATFIAEKEAEGQELIVPTFLLNDGYAKPIDQMTVDEFRGVKDAITSLAHLGRDQKLFKVEGEKLAMQQVIDEMREQLGDKVKPITQGIAQAVTDKEKRWIDFQGIRASLSLVEPWAKLMDGGNRGGPFTKYIVRPVMDAVAQYRLDQNAKLDRLASILTPRREELLRGKISAPEIGYTFNNKGELLHAIAHTGNDSNMKKLLLGRGWGEAKEGGFDRARWDSMIARMAGDGTLTKADFDTVQALWDLMEELKAPAQKSHREMYGVYFDELTTRPLQTPFGEYKGGYMPAIVDRFMVEDGQVRRDGEALKQQATGAMFPTTGRGFTRGRVEQYTKPLELNLSLIPSHIDSVLRFTHLNPAIRNAGRLMINREFRSMMNGVDQAAVSSMLVPWLERTARQSLETPSMGIDGRWADGALRALRRNSGIQMLAGNIINSLQQLGGIAPGVLKSSPGTMMRSLLTYTRQPGAVVEEITAQSEYMKARINDKSYDLVRQIEGALTKTSKLGDVQNWTDRNAYILQHMMQTFVDVTVWKAVHEHELAKGTKSADAIYAADAAVRETQGGFKPEETSRFMTGSPLKRIFVHMYNYFNTQANLLGTELALARQIGGKEGAKRAGAVLLFGLVAPAVIADAIVKTGTGGFRDWDEDDALAQDMASMFLGAPAKYAVGMVPVAGPILMTAVSDAPGDRIGSSPATSAVRQAAQAPGSIYDAITGEGKASTAVKETLTAIGLFTGLPLGQLGKPLGYLTDVASDEVEPEGAEDVARGLLSGKQSKNVQ